MPKLWDETIEAHRLQVRDAILEAAAGLASEHGPLNVTMSQIADEAGIGRATLYKYFSSIEEILRAWHDHQISRHLELLADIADRDEPAIGRLEAVLNTYAQIQHQRADHGAQPHGHELSAMLHRETDLAPAEKQLHDLVRTLIEAAAQDRQVRSDITPGELSTFCLHALSAASTARSKAATHRLVGLVLDGLRE
ncbi:MAG TPA: TetR/AcrR family transcriptional regulator [Nitriliruptorales bacterium]